MTDISFSEAFIKELEAEAPATRKCLERIPASLFDWKPHPKSMPMGYLSFLVAEIPLWIEHMIKESAIDFVTFDHFKPANTDELVAHFDDNVTKAIDALKNITEGLLAETFFLKSNGQVVFSATKRVNIESNINHLVHHRGQLTVYMRLNDIAVPSIYGPSADERGF